ncbi:MAG: hypothetical protein JWQ07_1590 [Ramlibacter sp.]|nr:hypothetical protein [Ramlibacter sp.]
MMRAGLARLLCMAVVVLAACGGGSGEVANAPAARAQAPQAAIALTPTALMDWAEQNYSVYFPGHSQDQALAPYIYRYYPATGNYLGVDGQNIYVLGPVSGGYAAPYFVGTMLEYTCQVYPQNCGSTVTGTAAAGAPIAGVTVTLKDSANNIVTAVTSAAGTYTFSTDGLTAPFLLQLTTPSGTTLYSVTADSGVAVVANLTPLTDLIVRSWYSVQGVSAATAFANPAAAPPPTRLQAGAVADVVLSVMQLALNNNGAGISAPLELINKPFTADHTGMDSVLDKTRVSYGSGATVTLTGNSKQQTSVIGYDTARSMITASSTVVTADNTSSSSISAVVPVQPAQVAAWSEIEAALAGFAALVNSKGTSLSGADLLPYLDPGLLQDGLNRDQFAAGTAQNFNQGQAIAMQIRRMASLDLAAGRADVSILATQSLGAQSETQDIAFFFQKVSGAWTLSGNQSIAHMRIFAEARINQGAYAGGDGPSINVDVRPVQGTVGTVTVVASTGSITMTRGPTAVDDSGVLLDSFFGNTGALGAGSRPSAGTLFTVTMTRPGTTAVTATIALNAFTTEGVPLTSPTGISLADAHLGGTLDVSWALPTTYAVSRVNLSALVFTGSQSNPSTFQCESPQVVLGATATAGTLNVPATCNGMPVVSVNINLSISGVNGERSQTIYLLQ